MTRRCSSSIGVRAARLNWATKAQMGGFAGGGAVDIIARARIGYAPLVIVVPASSSTKSLAKLIAEAKANPSKLTYAIAGNGSSGHLTGELLKSAAGIDVLRVPYKGGAPAITDLLGERISYMPINPLEVVSHIKAQRLVAVAVASDKRILLLKDRRFNRASLIVVG